MKYIISYAYDVPHFADFVVAAKTKRLAMGKAKAAFKAGKFRGVRGMPDGDQTELNHRIFVLRVADNDDSDLPEA